MIVNSHGLCFYLCSLKKSDTYIKLTGSYIHLDYGSHTCERYPGSIDYIQQDMQVGEALLPSFRLVFTWVTKEVCVCFVYFPVVVVVLRISRHCLNLLKTHL